MALTKQITWNTFDIPSAYAKIVDFTASKNSETTFKIRAHINVFKDDTKETCLYGIDKDLTIDYSSGIVKVSDIYDQIKKTDEFADWGDC